MSNGTLKIKSNGKVELKINGKEQSIPKEFDFSSFDVNTYNCIVELQAGKIINIIVNNSTVPKKDDELRKKEEQKMKQKNENKQPDINDSLLKKACKIPCDIPEISVDVLQSSNFALKYYKFSRFDEANKAKFYEGPQSGNFLIKTYDYGLNAKISTIAAKHKTLAENLFDKDLSIVKNFKPNWRVIVGLGTDSVYETGITLHHIYGFPYIPASAIKGITNHYAQDCDYDESHKSIYESIFGTTEKQGKITFFDAMPLTPPKIKPDIMNVHYPDYYGEGKAPTDTQKLNPIFFLTVEDTEFQFILGCKDKESNESNESKDLLKTAFEWMKKALSNKGIGAKTAVGYGYFSET
jgi:CRISPR-associated protein Cmr6